MASVTSGGLTPIMDSKGQREVCNYKRRREGSGHKGGQTPIYSTGPSAKKFQLVRLLKMGVRSFSLCD
jgi:hypothetical protein